ncbi:exonuclease domain-containing protein [Leptolyngbya sp. ST-U4]|uniref:exonuclease domain-containing protein n=2 Tax=unclassified Leptolyngbya TaxID=2650499 RepID=UPI0019AB11FF|nr:exonuclease [Cyanobacteria bacterium FACHB-502]
MKEFIVVDTEGSEIVREIAILNSEGQLVYEAFDAAHPDYTETQLKKQPLQAILPCFFDFAKQKQVIFHSANHDIQVLRQSCRKAGLTWRKIQFSCTYELAQHYLPDLPSYSLEYLSKRLNLKVNQKYFNPQQAHSARYDAEFTYQLYLKLMELKSQSSLKKALKDKPNPFSSSKVDNPFQDHPDLKQIYQDEFELLKATIDDIRDDRNHQSQGAVVIGEPGTGKTHLIMRLAKELLQVNRLLFIGQPNNPDSVLYHIYTRILKSFVETVPGNGFTQLENLLAHSFVRILQATSQQSNNDEIILSRIGENPLALYSLAKEGTDLKRKLWQHIERRTNEWWTSQYGLSGYSAQIIKGIIKFCSYTEPRRKELATRWLVAHELEREDAESIGLENWSADFSKEDFSLEAISVFSKLSLLDEPLIIVFDQLEGLGLECNRNLLERFGEAVKEIFTYVPNSLIILNLFPDRWQQFQTFFDGSVIDRISQHKVFLEAPTNQQIKEILQLKVRAIGIDLEKLFTSGELQQILSHRPIRAALNRAADYYRYKARGIPLPRSAQEFSESYPSPEFPISTEQRLDRLEQELSKFRQAIQAIATGLGSIYSTETNGETPVFQPFLNTEFNPHQNTHYQNGNAHRSDETLIVRLDATRQVLDYLKSQRPELLQDYDKLQIITDSDDIGKLTTIAEAFQLIQPFEIDCLRLGKSKLPENRVFQSELKKVAIGFLQIDGSGFTSRLKNFNELVVSHKDTRFLLWRDGRQPPITGKVGREEIEKLNNAANGEYRLMEENDRIDFELLYKLVIDIQNRDLDVDLLAALEVVTDELKDNWLIQLFQPERSLN